MFVLYTVLKIILLLLKTNTDLQQQQKTSKPILETDLTDVQNQINVIKELKRFLSIKKFLNYQEGMVS